MLSVINFNKIVTFVYTANLSHKLHFYHIIFITTYIKLQYMLQLKMNATCHES